VLLRPILTSAGSARRENASSHLLCLDCGDNLSPTDGLVSFIRAGMHEVKVSLQRDQEMLLRLSESKNPELIKKWVERIKSRYERWWIASQNMTSR